MSCVEFIRNLSATPCVMIGAGARLVFPFEFLQNVLRLSRHRFQASLWIFPLQHLLLGLHPQPLLDVMERGDVEFLQRGRFLNRDNVLSGKRCIIDQIFPILRFDVQLLDSLMRKHIASGGDGNNVRVLGEGLEQRWAMVFVVGILVERQFDQGFHISRFAGDWIHFESLEKIQNRFQFKTVAIEVAVWGSEGYHCDAAAIKRQSLEFDVLIFG